MRSHVNHIPGTHNFEQDNREQLYAAIGDYFFPGDATFRRTENPSSQELKTAEQLLVPLPADNVDFHRLAESLAVKLPHVSDLPADAETAKTWQKQQRERLQALLRVPNHAVTAEQSERLPDTDEQPGAIVSNSRVKIGNQWTVPVTSITPLTKQVPDTVILIADSGRASLAERAGQLAAKGHRVLAVDPLFIGASQVKAQDPDYTYPLLMSAAGERALGIQAAQLVAIARWANKSKVNGPVTLAASGPRASLAALVATAIEPDAIDRVELTDSLASPGRLQS